MKRLKDVEAPPANFFASGVLALEEKLGPIPWQLPPNFHFDPDRLDAFFGMLPRTTQDAAQLARRNDGKLRNRGWLKIDSSRPLLMVDDIVVHQVNELEIRYLE